MCVVQLFVYVSVCMYVSRGGGGEEEEGAIIHLIHLKASFYHMTSSHSLTLDIA